jgi:hypothetical protein
MNVDMNILLVVCYFGMQIITIVFCKSCIDSLKDYVDSFVDIIRDINDNVYDVIKITTKLADNQLRATKRINELENKINEQSSKTFDTFRSKRTKEQK